MYSNCSSCGENCTCAGGWYPVVGRVLLAALFLIIGFGKITGFAGTAAFVASAGLPMPEVFTVLAIILEVGGGLMLLLGLHARLGAWVLIVFTAVATAIYHNAFSDATQMIMMLKNLAIIGGLLYVAAYGPGKWSLDWTCGSKWCPDCKAVGSSASTQTM